MTRYSWFRFKVSWIIICILSLSSLYINHSFGQVVEKSKVSNVKFPDTAAINSFNQKAILLQGISLDSLFYYSKISFESSKATGYILGLGRAELNFGIYYAIKRDYINSLKNYYLALDISNRLNNKKNQNLIKIYIGDLLTSIKRNREAIKIFHEVARTADEINDTINAIKVLVSISKIDLNNDDYIAAKRNLLLAYRLSINCNNLVLQSRIYRDLGALYLQKRKGIGFILLYKCIEL